MFRTAGAIAVCCGVLFAFCARPTSSAQTADSPAISNARTQTSGDALAVAIRSGRIDNVKRLVAAGAEVNAPDALGSAPLLIAVWSGSTEIAEFLLAHGARVNAIQPRTGATPLEYAVVSGRAAMVKLLLGAGARVDSRSGEDRTVLHIAAARGDPEIIELLLGAHADLNSLDANGNTALDEAVLHGQTDAVRVLIAHGADVNRAHPLDGREAIHEACVKGFAALLEPLIEASADPVARDRFGQSPLDLALAYKNPRAVATLLRLSRKRPEIAAAAEEAMDAASLRGQTEIARMLINGGLAIDRPTAAGSTYLHDAALKGQVKVVQLLLDRGARVDALNSSGATALHDAALGGNPEVIAVLLDHSARIDAVDADSGATPLMIAAELGRTNAVALLLRRGANPRVQDRAGHTALDRAKQAGEDDAIKLLETAIAASQPDQPSKTGG